MFKISRDKKQLLELIQLFDADLWLLLPNKKQERGKIGWTILEEIKEHEREEGKMREV